MNRLWPLIGKALAACGSPWEVTGESLHMLYTHVVKHQTQTGTKFNATYIVWVILKPDFHFLLATAARATPTKVSCRKQHCSKTSKTRAYRKQKTVDCASNVFRSACII